MKAKRISSDIFIIECNQEEYLAIKEACSGVVNKFSNNAKTYLDMSNLCDDNNKKSWIAGFKRENKIKRKIRNTVSSLSNYDTSQCSNKWNRMAEEVCRKHKISFFDLKTNPKYQKLRDEIDRSVCS